MRRAPHVALGLAGVLLLRLTVLRAVECWRTDARLDHVAGIWVAEAMDLTKGVFYRAPYGPYGYGGTRFFPLFFSIHAAAIALFGRWRPTGYALSTVSVVLLLVAVYYLLRRIGATRWLAVAGCLAVLAGAGVQNSLFTIREDAMAAMLNLWAIVICAGAAPSRRRLSYAAALFTLAFAVKETTIFGAAAVFLYLLLNQQRRSAFHLLALTAGGYALVLAGIALGSGGRALDVFRLTAAAGVGLSTIAASPFSMVGEMDLFRGETILLVLGTAVLLATGARSMRQFPPLLFVCTLVGTLAIFSSEGIGGNHLMDLHIAAVVLLIDWAMQVGVPEFAISISAAACLIVWLGVVVNNVAGDAAPVREQLQAVVRAIERKDQPILAENPLVPIIAGQQPYLLDPFNFRIMLDERPALAEPMWKMLHEHGFAAVVLEHDPNIEEWRSFYTDTHFGQEFMDRLQQDYALAGTPGGQYLYLPRASPSK
jgi:hypothetical protein